MSTLQNLWNCIFKPKCFLIKFLLHLNLFLWLFAGNFLNLFRFQLNCLLLRFKKVHAIESQAKITYDRAHLRATTFPTLRIKWKSLVFHLWRLGRIVCATDAAGLCVLHCKCGFKVHFSPVQREVFATVLHANWTLQYFLWPAVRVSAAH